MVFDKNDRLLVQHGRASETSFHRLPGGRVRFRERLEDCVRREIKEETGLDVKVERLLWVRDFLDQSPNHSIELFFLATIESDSLHSTLESKAENCKLKFIKLEKLEKVVFYPRQFIGKLKTLRENRDWSEDNPYVGSVN